MSTSAAMFVGPKLAIRRTHVSGVKIKNWPRMSANSHLPPSQHVDALASCSTLRAMKTMYTHPNPACDSTRLTFTARSPHTPTASPPSRPYDAGCSLRHSIRRMIVTCVMTAKATIAATENAQPPFANACGRKSTPLPMKDLTSVATSLAVPHTPAAAVSVRGSCLPPSASGSKSPPPSSSNCGGAAPSAASSESDDSLP